MADLNLKTTYQDDVLDTTVNTQRKFNMIQNEDGTVSFEDVTTYSQVGDSFGALDINATNEAICGVNNKVDNFDLSSKQDVISGGASTITTSNLTASRALISNSSGKVAVSAVTSTELGYLDGVKSNVQTQLNNKSPLLTTGYFTGTWSIASYGYGVTITFDITKSGYTPLGIIGFNSGGGIYVSTSVCDIDSSTSATMQLVHVSEVLYAHSGTASIRVLYVKN